jgi:uncharacterized protein HemY
MNESPRINSLLEMLRAEPNDLFLNYALGMEYMGLFNWQAAEKAFQKVLQLNPSYIPVFYQLGKLHEANAKNEVALNYYKQGLELAKTQKENKAINEFGEAIFMLED